MRLCPKQAVMAASVPAAGAEVVYGGIGVDDGNARPYATSAPLSEPRLTASTGSPCSVAGPKSSWTKRHSSVIHLSLTSLEQSSTGYVGKLVFHCLPNLVISPADFVFYFKVCRKKLLLQIN